MSHLISKEKLGEYIQRLLQGITSMYRRHTEHHIITQVSKSWYIWRLLNLFAKNCFCRRRLSRYIPILRTWKSLTEASRINTKNSMLAVNSSTKREFCCSCFEGIFHKHPKWLSGLIICMKYLSTGVSIVFIGSLKLILVVIFV